MAKYVLDWKAPSERIMADVVETLDVKLQEEFCNEVATLNEDDKIIINRSKAKKWLTKHFDGTDVIEWKGRPETKGKKASGAERIGRFLRSR